MQCLSPLVARLDSNMKTVHNLKFYFIKEIF